MLTQILLAFQFAVALQGTILIYAPAYDPKTWYTILIAWAELVVIAAMSVLVFASLRDKFARDDTSHSSSLPLLHDSVSLPISRSPVFWKLLGEPLKPLPSSSRNHSLNTSFLAVALRF